MKSNNLEYIFNNIGEGSVLAFYGEKWTSKIIPFFTREKRGEVVPQHCGIAYQIQRSENNCSFYLSEQGFHGGQYRKIEIIKFGGLYYTIDAYFLKQKFIKIFKLRLTVAQIQIGISDAISQIGKKYGYNRLIFGWEFLEKVIPDDWQRKIYLRLNKKEMVRVCSTHIQFNLRKMGFDVPLDTFLTPLEITKLPFYV